MVAYKLVKYCRVCKERFVVERSKSRAVYCASCQDKRKEAI